MDTATATLPRPVTYALPTTAAKTSSLWRPAAAAGAVAAVATTTVAALGYAAGASLETDAGEMIPWAGFAQLTLFFTAVGVAIAWFIRRRAAQPAQTFVRATVALTALSLVPDALLSTDGGTKVTLMLTHLVAAAIVIPVLARRVAR